MGLVLIALFAIVKNNFTKEVIKGKLAPYGVWVCLIILAFWVWIRLPATRDPEIGRIKVLIFSIFDTTIILLGVLFGRTKSGLRYIGRALIIIGIIAIIGVLIFGRHWQESEGGRITFGYANPLAPADLAGLLVISSIGYWLAKRTVRSAVFAAIVVLLSVYTILITGTRGPLFILPLVVVVMAYFYRRRINFQMVIAIALLAMVAVGTFHYFISRSTMPERFGISQIEGGILVRVYMVKTSLAGWKTAPFLGTGPGDFAAQMAGVQLIRYPHNVLIEVLNELGLIGLALYLLLLYYGFRGMKMLSLPEFEYTEYKMCSVIVFACLLYEFILSFKTGSYAGSNMLYFFWGASIGAAGLGLSESTELHEYEYSDRVEEELVYD
jgi:O-antigen ligase